MFKLWRFNLKYIYSRIKQYFYFKTHQDLPWMSRDVNDFLIDNLKNDMLLLEFGSGRSTQFYAKRVKKVYSREHHKEWFKIVSQQISNFANIEYKLYDNLNDYANTDDIENNSLDIVVIDGRNRVNCLLNSIDKLKRGGVLVLDNAERYLSYDTSSPAKFALKNRDSKWKDVEKILKEKFWVYKTTDGVSDTLLFFKRK